MGRVRAGIGAVVLAARNENVRRVELCWGAAIAAEWAHFVALGIFAYHAGGASGVGLAGLVRLLPAGIVAPVAASLGDRVRRERLLLGVVLLGAVALGGSAAAAFSGATAFVYAGAAVVGISSTLVRPTLQALLPSLARTPEELIAANGATSTIESLGTFAGPLLAAAVVARAPTGVAFAAAGGLVLCGAVSLARVHVHDAPAPRRDPLLPGTLRMLHAGVEATARRPGTRVVAALMVAQAFVRGCLNVLIVVAAFRVLHDGGTVVGAMTAAIGVGGFVGAFAAMSLGGGRLAGTFAGSLVLWGMPIALIAPRPGLALALLLLALVGVANSIEDVAGFTLLQRRIPDDVLARVLGVIWGLAMGAIALGSLAAPALVRALGPRPAFVAVGALLPVLSIATYRRLVALDGSAAPGDARRLVHEVPLFGPLSLVAKERLAARLEPLSFAAGERVVASGETGDRFYIVGAGELDVDAEGTRKTLTANDYFGEIALLRDIPRTATVTATSDSRLYALRREDFLLAIMRHPAAARVADAVVDARLAAPPAAGA